MTREEFEKSEKIIQGLMEQQHKESIDSGKYNENEIAPIFDGIININEYLKADFKILWILQEPYDSEGGGWHIRERIYNAIKNKTFNLDWKTWEKVLYISWSILNRKINDLHKYSLIHWDSLPDYHSNSEMFKVLEKIAYINVKKLPNVQSTNASFEEIRNAYRENREILLRQIVDYCPQIIVGGNTLQFFYKDMEIIDSQIFKPDGKGIYYCFKK